MLLLGDTFHSLEAAMNTITQFGVFSGLHINGNKSALMLLDDGPVQPITPSYPVPVTSSIKYLGIQITPQLGDLSPECNPFYLAASETQFKFGTDFGCPWLAKGI